MYKLHKKSFSDGLLLIGKKLLEVKEIQEKTFGYVLKDNHIIGLGLYECELTQLPDSIYNLKFLEVLNLNYSYNLKILPENIGNLRTLKIIYSCINYLIGELVMTMINISPDEYEEILSYSTDKIFEKAKDQKIISNDQFNLQDKYRKPLIQPRKEALFIKKKGVQPINEDIFSIKKILKTIKSNKK